MTITTARGNCSGIGSNAAKQGGDTNSKWQQHEQGAATTPAY